MRQIPDPLPDLRTTPATIPPLTNKLQLGNRDSARAQRTTPKPTTTLSRLGLTMWIGLWQKLDCAVFVSFLLSFDVLCLTETFIDTDFQSDMFKDYLSFTAKAKKTLPPWEKFWWCCNAS